MLKSLKSVFYLALILHVSHKCFFIVSVKNLTNITRESSKITRILNQIILLAFLLEIKSLNAQFQNKMGDSIFNVIIVGVRGKTNKEDSILMLC